MYYIGCNTSSILIWVTIRRSRTSVLKACCFRFLIGEREHRSVCRRGFAAAACGTIVFFEIIFGRLTFLSIPHIRQTQIHMLASSEYINIEYTHWRNYAINSATPNDPDAWNAIRRVRLVSNRLHGVVCRKTVVPEGLDVFQLFSLNSTHARLTSRKRVCRALHIDGPRFYITVTAAGGCPGES